jgi:sugar lactone lactonase YvrE
MNLSQMNLRPFLSMLGIGLTLHVAGFAIDAKATQNNNRNVIIQGSSGPVGSVNGIDFDQFHPNKKRLFGASTVDSKVFVIDPQNGKTIDEFGPELGLLGPDDVAVGPDGAIFFTDTLGGYVGKIDPVTRTMTKVSGFVPLPLVNSIAFSTAGDHLYAGQCFLPPSTPPAPQLPPPFTNGLWEIDQTGTVPPRFITDQLGPFCSVNSFDYKDGHIYGPQIITGQILRVDPATGAFEVVVNVGHYTNPSAVQFDAEGRLYVIDSSNNELSRIDHPELNNQIPVVIGTLPGDSGVDNLAIDKNDSNRLYVSSGNDGYIVRVNEKNGNTKNYAKTDGLVLPLGVVALGDNTALVGDFNSLRIVDTQQKKIVSSTSTKIDLTGQSIIRSLSLAKFGSNVVLGDWFGKAIQLWDYENEQSLARITPADSPLNVLGYNGTIISAQFNPGSQTAIPPIPPRASIVQHSGTNFQTATVLWQQPGAFTGLATDGTSIWVADAFTGIIFKLTINPSGPNTFTPVAVGLSGPEGLALDNDGQHLYVVEAGAKRLSRVDLNGFPGQNVTTIEENIPVGSVHGFAPPFFFVSGVSVDPDDGTVYYTGDVDRVLKKVSNNNQNLVKKSKAKTAHVSKKKLKK